MDRVEELERALWLGGPEVYRTILTQDCLMMLPPPVGRLCGREAVLRSLESAPRWIQADFQPQVVWRTADALLIAYEATAWRDGAEPYRTLASSLYVQSDGQWRLALHQQTPQA